MEINDEKMRRVCALLNENDVYHSRLSYGEDRDYSERMDALYLDGDVTFELMEKIVEIVKEN